MNFYKYLDLGHQQNRMKIRSFLDVDVGNNLQISTPGEAKLS